LKLLEKRKVKKVSFSEFQASHKGNDDEEEEDEEEENHRDGRCSNRVKNTLSFHHESLECKSNDRPNDEEKEISESTFEEEAHSLLNIHLVSTLTNSPSEQSIGINAQAKNFFFEQTEQQINDFKVRVFIIFHLLTKKYIFFI
jgi:hypothetical protein